MSIKVLLDEIKKSSISKLVYNNNIVGLRVQTYSTTKNGFSYYDFDLDTVKNNTVVRNFINANQSKFKSILLKQYNGLLVSQEEYEGKITVQEFKSENDAVEVLKPVMKVYQEG